MPSAVSRGASRRASRPQQPQGAPVRSAQARILASLPERTRLRILHAGIAAGNRFQRAGVHPGRPPSAPVSAMPRTPRPASESSTRLKVAAAKAANRFGSCPRKRAKPVCASASDFECKNCGAAAQEPRAVSVFVQLAIWGMPALPGIRQHHRHRHGLGDSRQAQEA